MNSAAAATSELETSAAGEAGTGFVRMTRRVKRLFRGAPLSWMPVWQELELRLWHRDWRRVAASEVAEECGFCVRTVKRVFYAFEVLGILNIRHTKGGSYKNTCWLQLLELPKVLEIPESLRRFGERNRAQRRALPEPAAVNDAAAAIFGAELASAPANEAERSRSEDIWQRIRAELRDDTRRELEGLVARVRTITRGVLVLETTEAGALDAYHDALRFWGRQNGVDDVVFVAPDESWPPVEAAETRTDEPLADQAVRMVQEFFQVMHGVPAEEAARLVPGAGLLRRDVALAAGLLELNGQAAWGYVSRACQRLARQAYRGETFLYLIPHLARVGARWPGQEADTPAGVRRPRAA